MKPLLSLTIALGTLLLCSCSPDPEKNHGFSGANNPGGSRALAAMDASRVFPDGIPSVIDGERVSYDASDRVSAIGSAAKFTYLSAEDADKMGYNILLATTEGTYKLCINDEGWVGYAERENGERINLAYTLTGYLNHIDLRDPVTDCSVELVFYYEDDNLLTGKGTCSYPGYSGRLDVTLSYTNTENPDGIDNMDGLIFMNHGIGAFDLGGLQWAYYAGMLGKPSRQLPLQMTTSTHNDTSTQEFYDWQLDAEGYPASVTVSETGMASDRIRYAGATYNFSWK